MSDPSIDRRYLSVLNEAAMTWSIDPSWSIHSDHWLKTTLDGVTHAISLSRPRWMLMTSPLRLRRLGGASFWRDHERVHQILLAPFAYAELDRVIADRQRFEQELERQRIEQEKLAFLAAAEGR